MLSVAWRIAVVGLLVLPSAAIGQIEQVEPVPRLPWDVPDLQGIWLRQSSTPAGARGHRRRQGGADSGRGGGVSDAASCRHQPVSGARPQCRLAIARRPHGPPHVVDRQPSERTSPGTNARWTTPRGDARARSARPGRRRPRGPGVLRTLRHGAVSSLRRAIVGRAAPDLPERPTTSACTTRPANCASFP